MKNLLLFLIVASTFSCSPTLTEIWVRDVSSNRVEVTMDMGESINAIGGLLNEMKEDDGSSESFNIYDNEKKMDTTLNFFSVMPDSVREQLTDPQALEIMNMHLKVDPENETGMLKVNFDYKNQDELERFFAAVVEMEALNKDAQMAPGQGDSKEMLKGMLSNHSLDLDNQVIRVPRADPLKELKDNGLWEELQPQLDSLQYLPEDSFQRQMIEMMIPGETKTIVHAPGKILFTSDPRAEINGNSVTFTSNIMKVLAEGGEVPTNDIIIKFKK